MSHVFQIPDNLYEKLAAYAARQEQTPETLFLAWVNEITRRQAPLRSSCAGNTMKCQVKRPAMMRWRRSNKHLRMCWTGILPGIVRRRCCCIRE